MGEHRRLAPVLRIMVAVPELAEWCTPAEGRGTDTIWCGKHSTWLRLDGQWVSGWEGGSYFAFRPKWWNRLRIRLAAKRFRRIKAPYQDTPQ